jgi:hypothetical protein
VSESHHKGAVFSVESNEGRNNRKSPYWLIGALSKIEGGHD